MQQMTTSHCLLLVYKQNGQVQLSLRLFNRGKRQLHIDGYHETQEPDWRLITDWLIIREEFFFVDQSGN